MEDREFEKKMGKKKEDKEGEEQSGRT